MKPERVQRDHAEREVDRRGDLAVRDGGERGRVEDALQLRQLACHHGLPQEVEARGAERDEERADRVADRAAALVAPCATRIAKPSTIATSPKTSTERR